jgi:hypothetical protein
VPRLAQQQRADDEGHAGDDDWVIQTRIDITGVRDDC